MNILEIIGIYLIFSIPFSILLGHYLHHRDKHNQ